jgi:hypothetical protein
MSTMRTVTMSDGNVRPVDGSPHELLVRVGSMEAHGRAAEEFRRLAKRRCELATADRKAIATLMCQRGLSQFWHEGHIYRLSAMPGTDIVVERCPAIATLKVADGTAEEEARAGAMPGEPEGQPCQGCFQDVPPGDTLARYGVRGADHGTLFCRDCADHKGLLPRGPIIPRVAQHSQAVTIAVNGQEVS